MNENDEPMMEEELDPDKVDAALDDEEEEGDGTAVNFRDLKKEDAENLDEEDLVEDDEDEDDMEELNERDDIESY